MVTKIQRVTREKIDFLPWPNKLHDAFILFDVDHDGRITEKELKNVLNFLSIPASPAEVKKMIADADTDAVFFHLLQPGENGNDGLYCERREGIEKLKKLRLSSSSH
ncbi:hypothetical protein ACTXT7_010004 [Hymenolepis weldensis]